MDVLSLHPIRKTKVQKAAFRDDVVLYLKSFGYDVEVQSGDFGAKNVIVGNPKSAKILVTAHYDTPARLPFPNLITPCHAFPFIVYQLLLTVLLFIIPALAWIVAGHFGQPDIGRYMASVLFFVEMGFMLFGPSNKTNANDNTSGVVTLLNIAKDVPVDSRSAVCFVLFDLEEAGLIGSASHAQKYAGYAKQQICLNLDCVGDGNNIVLFPSGKLKKDDARMSWLNQMVSNLDDKSIVVREKGFSYYPSDQQNFTYGVGIAALNKTERGWLYCDKIHTKNDVILDERNVSYLSTKIIDLICNSAMLPELTAVKEKHKLKRWQLFLLYMTISIVGGMLFGMALVYLFP